MSEVAGSPLIWALALIALVGLVVWINLRQWRTDRRLALQLRRELEGYIPGGYPPNSPKVSFLVAAWNEKDMIQRCIQSVLALPYPDLELVLCAGGPDGTFGLARQASSDPRLLLLEQQPGEGKQRSLQRCLEASRGKIIYLIDADCLIEQRTFDLCLRPILEGREEVVTGSFYHPLLEQAKNPFVIAQLATQAYAAAHQLKYVEGLLGGNCAMLRTTLHSVGEFRNAVTTGTDYDLAKRLRSAGNLIILQRQAFIRAEFPETIRQYIRQQSRWIRNVVKHGFELREYGEAITNLRTALLGIIMIFLPALAILIFFSGAHGRFFSMLIMISWISLFGFVYFARLRYQSFCRIWLSINHPPRLMVRLPVYILVDFVAWMAALVQLIFRPLRSQW